MLYIHSIVIRLYIRINKYTENVIYNELNRLKIQHKKNVLLDKVYFL